ncbi:MAG: hypothetical protein JXA30_00415 [Deltaproteobacteria bacterium]|nr:hypothetical protein [Deltaproteobacteria bacterium]
MYKSLFSIPLILAIASVALVGTAAWPYSVDDSYIVARYAERIAEGKGYTMNDGEPTDGVTAPLWLIPAIAASSLGLCPLVANKAVGLFCTMLAIFFLMVWIRSRAQGRIASWFACVIVATQPTFGIWAVAGLETGAATLAFVVALLAAFHRPRPMPIVAGIAIASLAWLRPEMALSSAVVLIALAMIDRVSGITAGCIALLSVIAVIAFRFMMFGRILPLAYDAKPGTLFHGFYYAVTAALVITSGVGIWIAWRGSTRNRDSDRAIGLAVIAHLISVVLAGGDWMPGFRLLAPILPAYALLAALGTVALVRAKVGRAWLTAVLVFASLLSGIDAVVQIPEIRVAGETRAKTGKALAKWLSNNFRTVAMVDIGFLAYESKVEVVDLGGVTDPVVANFPGGHISKEVDIGYLQSKCPDAIVLHSTQPPGISEDGTLFRLSGFPVEQRIAANAWVRDRFRVARVIQYSKNYYYTVLKRR